MAGAPEQGARSLRTHFDLIPLDQARNALPGRLHAALERGTLVLDPAHKAFYRRVDLSGERYIGSEAEVIRADHLPIDLGQALLMEVVRYVVVALALLVPIALWSRTHWQALQTLSRVADEFGAGQLSARARTETGRSGLPAGRAHQRDGRRIQGCWNRRRTCCIRSRTNCARRSRAWNSRWNCWASASTTRPCQETHRGDGRRPGRTRGTG
jgi:hypothetical protein